MKQDIDHALRGWELKPGMVQARMVHTGDGRQVIQMRIDLGILQIETGSRPDGTQPHGFPTFFDYLREQSRIARQNGQEFILNQEQCMEADREFLQFYHRRICWLALRNYAQAVADADHTLAFMDFVARHSPSEEYTQAHEQYRGFVLFQRTQASAALRVETKDAEGAIDEVRAGLERMRSTFAVHGMEEQFDEVAMVQHLRKVESSLREEYNIEATLREQLEQAVANEDYERAARLRDALKRRE
jgi:hypothetical protein